MKGRVIEKCRNSWIVFAEKCLEWSEYLYNKVRHRDKYHSNLREVYSIKSNYIDEEFVKEFLGEREKIIRLNRYRMEIKEDKEADNEICTIGTVNLYRKKKFIHKATLVIKPKEKTRLIYWKFDN